MVPPQLKLWKNNEWKLQHFVCSHDDKSSCVQLLVVQNFSQLFSDNNTLIPNRYYLNFRNEQFLNVFIHPLQLEKYIYKNVKN